MSYALDVALMFFFGCFVGIGERCGAVGLVHAESN